MCVYVCVRVCVCVCVCVYKLHERNAHIQYAAKLQAAAQEKCTHSVWCKAFRQLHKRDAHNQYGAKLFRHTSK